MVFNKRKKNSRQRASMTHGWGSKKKHRGSGNRGGKGMAGTGKKADSKKPSVWKNKDYFGKKGFKMHSRALTRIPKSINIGYIAENISELASSGLASKKNDYYEINLQSAGYTKLLGKGNSGKIKEKLNITVGKATKKAVQAVESAGGKVILTGEPESAPGNESGTKPEDSFQDSSQDSSEDEDEFEEVKEEE